MGVTFVQMYDECYDDVYRYVYFKVGNKWDTDDIVSETFRKSFERKTTLHEIENPKAWLLMIARNTIIDFYRKKKSVLMGDETEFYFSPLPFEDPFEESDEMVCLKKSLHHLPKEDLELANLRYFAGLKFKEIEVVLQKSEQSLRVKSSRITKKLGLLVKKCLGET
ncbi:RNA polymerase sigma factor [Schinkia sp. CFF1]